MTCTAVQTRTYQIRSHKPSTLVQAKDVQALGYRYQRSKTNANDTDSEIARIGRQSIITPPAGQTTIPPSYKHRTTLQAKTFSTHRITTSAAVSGHYYHLVSIQLVQASPRLSDESAFGQFLQILYCVLLFCLCCSVFLCLSVLCVFHRQTTER